jgi:PAS domain S-box-containing protein
MSMEYGLRASLLSMRKRFQDLLDSRRIDTGPIYLRLMFADSSGEVLVDVGGASNKSEPWIGGEVALFGGSRLVIFRSEKHDHVVLLYPYVFKGMKIGTIFAEINHKAAFQKFVQRAEGDGLPAILHPNDKDIFEYSYTEEVLQPALLGERAGKRPQPVSGKLSSVIKVPVSETPFTLESSIFGELQDDYLTSTWYLASLSFLAVLLFFSVGAAWRIKTKNLILHTSIAESKHHRQELSKQNRLLSLEIEKRKDTEKALKESTEQIHTSQQQLKYVIDGANLGYWDWYYQTNEHEVNDRWLGMLGLDRQDIDNHVSGWKARIHPDDRDRMLATVDKSIISRKGYVAEFRMQHKDGQWVWIQGSGTVVEYDKASHEPIRICGTHQDITERKQAEEALGESENRFSLFMDHLPAIVFIKDEKSRTLYVNKCMNDVFGAKDWIGKTPVDLFPEEIGKAMIADDKNALAKDYQMIVETVPNRYGANHIYQTHKFSIERSGKPPLLGGIALDITKRKQAEEALKTSLEEKEVLLREIHHRVKNNMQVVSSLIGIQRAELKGKTDPSALTAFHETETRIKSMALVHEKLYSSHNFASIDFASYAQQLAVELFSAYEIQSNQVSLDTQIEDVKIDINQAIPCGLILNELLSNALKYAFPNDRKGKIIVALKSLKEGILELSVCDDGKGISDEVELASEKTTGITIVNALARQLRAEIAIERNNGTCFHIRFKGK